MALGVNLTWGMAGMVNLGLAGFFAVGGYATALLTKAGFAIPFGVAAGALVAALAGAGVALITARLRADYLAIVTLGFSESVRIVASNELWLTNGSDGIAGIAGPWRGALSPSGFNLLFLAIVLGVLGATVLLMQRLAAAPFGRVLRALRDDEDVAAVAGKPVLVFKLKAFAIGAGVLGLAGALYAHYTSYIAPDIFAPLLTINIVLALVVGGVGNNTGAVVGAVILVVLLEGTRFAAPLLPFLSAAQIAAMRELLISGLLLVILRVLPGGIIPERIGT
jgi:branched-chain amino acid transport system permease protein